MLGGTALMGGRGTILGTVLGTLTIAVIGNGLILMHISPFFTQIVTGAIILVAIWLNTRIFTPASAAEDARRERALRRPCPLRPGDDRRWARSRRPTSASP